MSDDYTTSFTVEQIPDIKNFFDKNGFVVVDNVLTDAECDATVEEFNQICQKLAPEFDINDRSTYDKYPSCNNYGLVSSDPIFTEQIVRNRVNVNILGLFSNLYDVPVGNLLCNHDRFTFYRPTRQINGVGADRPDWKTSYTYPGLHLDHNPNGFYYDIEEIDAGLSSLDYSQPKDFIRENNRRHEKMGTTTQAIINLWDNKHEDGGHLNSAGFHKFHRSWVDERMKEDPFDPETRQYEFSKKWKSDMKYLTPERITCRKGSIIVWDARMSHGTYPNNSANGRILQFLQVFPQKILPKEALKKRQIKLRTTYLRTIASKISNLSTDQLKVLMLR